MKGETVNPGMKIIHLNKGYTNIAAEYVHEACGGDLFEIIPVRAYDPDHMKMIYEAKEEFDQNARPAVRDLPESIAGCELIYLCFPNWWGTMPMPVFTFLGHYDWNGKIIAPLVTSGGSGFANALDDLRKMCPGAMIAEGLEIAGHETENSRELIKNWARRIKQDEERKER